MAATSREESYRDRRRSFEARASALEQKTHRISNLRGLAFATFAVAGLIAAFGDGGLIAATVSVAGLAAFILAVAVHVRVFADLDEARRWAQVNANAELRCGASWTTLPTTGHAYAADSHPYAEDLDLFGRGSLFQKIAVAHTRYGQDRLAEMLKVPAAPVEIRERQDAVRALSHELEWRQSLETHGIAASEGNSTQRSKRDGEESAPPDPEPFLRWVEAPPTLLGNRAVRAAAWALPSLTVAAAIAGALSLVPAVAWALPLAVQIALLLRLGQSLSDTFSAVSTSKGSFVRYGSMLEMVEAMSFESPRLIKLRAKLAEGGLRPSAAMRRFHRIMGWFELRHNGMVHPLPNIALLWDLHCVLALERWKSEVGTAARAWFDTVGELEALSSFAGLLYDEPEYCLAKVTEGPPRFVATGIGHPLIPGARRVANDVCLIGPGKALLVTGSNMSGKSTLLRAMGLAAVMAYAGAPVCAKHLELSEATIRTSIRVRDSLQAGVSHFYAEIEKLRLALDGVTADRPVFFLLDEILHGTNSTERQAGARWVLAELLRFGCIGAVSTHDTELCRLEGELMARVDQVHFQESTHEGRMSFDYVLRPGPVRAGNALRLMRLVGLEVPLPQEECPPGATSG